MTIFDKGAAAVEAKNCDESIENNLHLFTTFGAGKVRHKAHFLSDSGHLRHVLAFCKGGCVRSGGLCSQEESENQQYARACQNEQYVGRRRITWVAEAIRGFGYRFSLGMGRLWSGRSGSKLLSILQHGFEFEP